jgi:hypothetical protein
MSTPPVINTSIMDKRKAPNKLVVDDAVNDDNSGVPVAQERPRSGVTARQFRSWRIREFCAVFCRTWKKPPDLAKSQRAIPPLREAAWALQATDFPRSFSYISS